MTGIRGQGSGNRDREQGSGDRTYRENPHKRHSEFISESKNRTGRKECILARYQEI